jgi:hypothetical protein
MGGPEGAWVAAPARVRPRWRIALAAALIVPLGLLTRSGLPLPGAVRD